MRLLFKHSTVMRVSQLSGFYLRIGDVNVDSCEVFQRLGPVSGLIEVPVNRV